MCCIMYFPRHVVTCMPLSPLLMPVSQCGSVQRVTATCKSTLVLCQCMCVDSCACSACCMLQIGSALFPGVVRQLWGDKAETEWLDLQALCRWVETGLGWHIS